MTKVAVISTNNRIYGVNKSLELLGKHLKEEEP